MKDKALLGLGALLVVLALLKPDLGGFFNTTGRINNQKIEQIDDESQAMVRSVVDILKSGSSDRKEDGQRLASLFADIAALIQLDGEDQIISNTEEIKEANVIAGKLLKLNLKNKYPNLALECSNYITKLIGDDNVALDTDLRNKAVQAFRGLAWACNEGSK
jgi:hypothetical protein